MPIRAERAAVVNHARARTLRLLEDLEGAARAARLELEGEAAEKFATGFSAVSIMGVGEAWAALRGHVGEQTRVAADRRLAAKRADVVADPAASDG